MQIDKLVAVKLVMAVVVAKLSQWILYSFVLPPLGADRFTANTIGFAIGIIIFLFVLPSRLTLAGHSHHNFAIRVFLGFLLLFGIGITIGIKLLAN
jgi:hypothetical protein